jgi:outer membrane protein OmpA-like peptidoglycan-associated protein
MHFKGNMMTKNLTLTTSKTGLNFRRQLMSFAMATSVVMPAYSSAQNEKETAKLVVQQDRINDGAIHRDNGVYRDTQQRIKKLNDGGLRVADYHLSKAQCWLDVSFHEYSRNDRSHFPQEALTESQRILSALEIKQNPGQETPLVNGAEKLRLDLWARYDELKKHAGYQCAAQQTACAEVELVHAGNEIHEAGWRHAKPYIQIAEDLLGAAKKSATNCLPVVALVKAPEPASLPLLNTAVPANAPPMKEKIVLSADALFHFDKFTTSDLLPKGRAELDDLAKKMSTGKTRVTGLTLIGYTDRLGTVPYNLRLSLARANTVKSYLQQQGVNVPIAVEGRGLQDQVIACSDVKQSLNLRDCLQPNRRVEVIIDQSDRY